MAASSPSAIPSSTIPDAVDYVRRSAPAMFVGNGRRPRRIMLGVAKALTAEGYTVFVNGYQSFEHQGRDISHFDTVINRDTTLVVFPPGVEPGFVFG